MGPELDFSREWSIVAPRGAAAGGPAAWAAEELSSIIGGCPGCARPILGGGDEAERIIILDAGSSARKGRREGAPRFSWRASEGRVEIYGADEPSLLRGTYDFLDALGFRWVEPGAAGERLPRGPRLALAAASRSSSPEALGARLVLGHGCLLENWEAELAWAARLGYSSVFIHTTRDALALGAAPERLYDRIAPELGAAAFRLGLRLELGGHLLSALLPRSLFAEKPEAFRLAGGERRADRNLCTTNGEALELASEALVAWARAHPEIAAFHAWPDDLPGGGWCECPSCARLSPAAQSLLIARALAAALPRARPEATLSFLAYHDSEDAAGALRELASMNLGGAGAPLLPPNLELLWAPRRRSWGQSIADSGSRLNAASLAGFRSAARAWREAGGAEVSVFEYYEDAMLWKGAVPPLSATIEGDLAAYRGRESLEAADSICLLRTGGRLPLAPRPNATLLPALAAAPGGPDAPGGAAAFLETWCGAAYGPAAAEMLQYWRNLEEAWAIDLDLEEGETGILVPEPYGSCAEDPPADWGDPRQAGIARLAAKLGRCDELFDRLRAAESCLERALAAAGEEGSGADAVRRETAEYRINGAVLELNCARLAAYRELAAGEIRAAADIANLALSASGAVRAALRALPDRRSRREISFLIGTFYDLELRAIRRANARSALRRLVDSKLTLAAAAFGYLGVARAFEPRNGVLGLVLGRSRR